MKRKSTAKAILSNLHVLRERRYVGDLGASDTLIDFERALALAKLTKRQSEAIRLHYYDGYKQAKVAEIMKIAQQNVGALLERATDEIDEVYEMWAWLDGELTPADFVDEIETEENLCA
ncbi:hypothetical protein 8F11_47 [uncultured Caudovirales phage]|uniref:RNA polymerase sigma factor 70 region 4 type 2 domain-containing protein n=1 Tax=uncultured Caudovirales phage TaxID=2100421 RepID=A0A2H4IZP0_9CAUD|nr:hypothetical protein 8F11_47 [uncultured Caudovirales phage]